MAVAAAQTKKATEPVFDGLNEIWLPFVDTYRTLLLAPPDGVVELIAGADV